MSKMHWLSEPGELSPGITKKKLEGKVKEYKIRELKQKDQERIAKIFTEAIRVTGKDSLRNIIKSGNVDSKKKSATDQKSEVIEIMIDGLIMAMGVVKKECDLFFCDLIGATYDEYRELPIDIDIRIIEQIREAPEVESFFTRAWRIYNMTEKLKTVLAGIKDRFVSAWDSTEEN